MNKDTFLTEHFRESDEIAVQCIYLQNEFKEALKAQRELLTKQMFESEIMFVQQYLLGVIEGYERCIKLVEYYEVDEDKT